MSESTPPWVDRFREIVRPFLAILFPTALVVLVGFGKLPPESLESLALLIVGFYFAERAALKRPGIDSTGTPREPEA